MVVMEYLNPSQYQPFRLSSDKEAIPEVTKSHIIALHERGYVHGDIRRPNILIGADNAVKLVDFDWAGKIREARYPPHVNLNLDGLDRPDWVEGEKLITVEHDLEMVKLLLVDPPSQYGGLW